MHTAFKARLVIHIVVMNERMNDKEWVMNEWKNASMDE